MKNLFLIVGFTMLIVGSCAHANNMNDYSDIQGVILAAGGSTRFKTGISKLRYPVCGREMVMYPVSLLNSMGIGSTLVVGFQQEAIRYIVNNSELGASFVEQKEQLGTGHALLCSRSMWHANNILVMNGDVPLITKKTIEKLCQQHMEHNAAISVVAAHNVDPNGTYGRIVQESDVSKIVEAKHFTYDIKDYPLINAGIYLINKAFLEDFLGRVERNKQTHEFYITDLVEIASANGVPVTVLQVPFDTIRGVNTLKELAALEHIKQMEILDHWMANGVRFNKPETVHVDVDVTIGAGTLVDSGVLLRGKTTIGDECLIGAYSVLDNALIPAGSTIPEFSVLKNGDLSNSSDQSIAQTIEIPLTLSLVVE